jgi:hypothetical protein
VSKVKREIHVLVSFPGRLLGIYDYNTQMSCNLNKGEEVFRQGCTDFYSPGHSGQTPDVKSWRFAQNVVCMVVGNAARLPEFEYTTVGAQRSPQDGTLHPTMSIYPVY